MESLQQRVLKNPVESAAAVIAVAFALFQLWISAGGVLATLQQCFIHLGFAMTLVFMLKPAVSKDSRFSSLRWLIDGPCVLLSIIVSAYIFFEFLEIAERGGGDPTTADVALGVIAVVLVIEGTRRVVGWALPIIAIAFLAYAFLGPNLPEPFDHRGFDLDRVSATLYTTVSGIAGAPLQVSASFVAIFVIFAAFLEVSGAGQFFIDWSYAGFGWLRGGPAKVAIFASALMGTISGSAVANVVGTGTFTIPVMKRTGLSPSFAGAVEAAASSGGQIMPPVMGAAAFIMVEIMGASYTSIMTAAIFPGLLYFFAIFCMVDFEVARQGIRGVDRKSLPSATGIFKEGWHLLIPLLLLIYLLVIVQYTPIKSAFYSLLAAVAVSWMRCNTRMRWEQIFEALRRGGNAMLEVAMTCACAGVVVGTMLLTGLALRLSEILINFSGGELFPLLLLTMGVSLILGMGLPTSAVYVVLATLVVPAMTLIGADKMAAHMFVFYFGVLANVTPPVAIAAYAAAAIAKSNPMMTGFHAFRLALAGFLLPFIWIYNPALLLQGEALDICLAVVTSVAGIVVLAAAVQGYVFGGGAPWYMRLVLFAAAILLVKPGLMTDLMGAGLAALVLAARFTIHRSMKQLVMPERSA